MKKGWLIIGLGLILLFTGVVTVNAQCSICTKSASQLGAKPAKGLNAGILYLMLTPLSVAGYLGFKWWRKEKEMINDDQGIQVE